MEITTELKRFLNRNDIRTLIENNDMVGVAHKAFDHSFDLSEMFVYWHKLGYIDGDLKEWFNRLIVDNILKHKDYIWLSDVADYYTQDLYDRTTFIEMARHKGVLYKTNPRMGYCIIDNINYADYRIIETIIEHVSVYDDKAVTEDDFVLVN